MAVSDKWDDVYEAFDRLELHNVLHPTLAAMRKLVSMIRYDPAFANVHPRVSLASIVFSRESATRGVYVGWKEDNGYDVAFVGPKMELSEATMVREEVVARVLRGYL